MKSNETLADELMNDSLTYAFIGWPYPKPDVTALKIKKNFSLYFRKKGFEFFILSA
mgnify:CR=1 FL=1